MITLIEEMVLISYFKIRCLFYNDKPDEQLLCSIAKKYGCSAKQRRKLIAIVSHPDITSITNKRIFELTMRTLDYLDCEGRPMQLDPYVRIALTCMDSAYSALQEAEQKFYPINSITKAKEAESYLSNSLNVNELLLAGMLYSEGIFPKHTIKSYNLLEQCAYWNSVDACIFALACLDGGYSLLDKLNSIAGKNNIIREVANVFKLYDYNPHCCVSDSVNIVAKFKHEQPESANLINKRIVDVACSDLITLNSKHTLIENFNKEIWQKSLVLPLGETLHPFFSIEKFYKLLPSIINVDVIKKHILRQINDVPIFVSSTETTKVMSDYIKEFCYRYADIVPISLSNIRDDLSLSCIIANELFKHENKSIIFMLYDCDQYHSSAELNDVLNAKMSSRLYLNQLGITHTLNNVSIVGFSTTHKLPESLLENFREFKLPELTAEDKKTFIGFIGDKFRIKNRIAKMTIADEAMDTLSTKDIQTIKNTLALICQNYEGNEELNITEKIVSAHITTNTSRKAIGFSII